jgi:hypothetical protein
VRIDLTSLVLLTFILGCSSNGGGTGTTDGPPGQGPDGTAPAGPEAGLPDAGGGGDSGPGGADGGGSSVVTYQDVKPIFATKCVPCHLPGGQGAPFHTLADSYATANNPAGSCSGKKVGECTLELVKSGYMPFMRKCTGDPSKDAANPACLTAQEQQKLADWIAGGLLEK